jgi:hypothetical protein
LQRLGGGEQRWLAERQFYSIEYAFALIGALQIWRNYLRDPQGTVHQYPQALSLGATRALPALSTAAGAQFALDATTLQEIVQFVTDQIEELKYDPRDESCRARRLLFQDKAKKKGETSYACCVSVCL